jgi:aconitate hydratase
LIHDIVRFHLAAEARVEEPWEIGEELPIRADHVLAGGQSGLLALTAFERIAPGAPRVELALASADHGAGATTFETSEEVQALHAVARRTGVRFSRVGHGRGDTIHHERFAVPGRVLLTTGVRPSAAGALGMLTLVADPIEAAAALAGGAYFLAWPGVRYALLTGTLAPAVDGHDVRLALARLLAGTGPTGAFLECAGGGISALSMADRFGVAAGADAFGARAVLLPSDEVTRAFMKAEAREPEWKAFATAEREAADFAAEVDLAVLAPLVAPLAALHDARPVAETGETAIDTIEVGEDAAAAELGRLAALLEGHRVREGVTLVVVPGSRQIMETAREAGVLDRLAAAGARVLEPGTRSGLAGPASTRAGLCVGVRLEDAEDPRARWWSGGIATCAAAARTGWLTDPRGLDLPRAGGNEPEAYVLTDAWIVRPGAGTDPDGDAAGRSPQFPLGTPIDGALRGGVLAVLGDDVGADAILPWGARVRPLLGDIPRLAEFVLGGIDAGFPERAIRHGGGWIVAGARFGRGIARDPAALAPLALGVRVVIAVSIAPDYRRHLVHAGILPLRFVVAGDHGGLGEGDELEIPGLPDALEPGVPLVVRNLTRGTRFTVRHDLNARQLDTVVAGGLLPRVARMAARPQ